MHFWKKLKDIFKKRYWILTCMTEDLEICNQEIFRSYDEAYSAMVEYQNDNIKILGDAVIEDHLFPYSATIVFDDQPCVIESKIICIEK